MNVYNTNSTDFDKVYAHGQENFILDTSLSLQEDDLYYLKLYNPSFSFDIFSVLNNELIAHVPNQMNRRQGITSFFLENNNLYILKYCYYEEKRFFEIYQCSITESTLLKSNIVPDSYADFFLSDDSVFFTAPITSSQGTVHVFNLNENFSLSLVGSFAGGFQSRLGDQPDNYIINHHNNNIILRDITNFEHILLNQTVLDSNASIRYIKDGYFLLRNSAFQPIQFSLAKYDVDNKVIQQIHHFPMNRETSYQTLNSVISNNASYRSDISEFFSILDDRVVKIGEKFDKDRFVSMNVFYPAYKKLIQIAGSGIWSYDIDFDEWLNQSDDAIDKQLTGLLYNYPNPFNPETSIVYSINKAGNVKIDIFNVRGQKVRTLVDSYRDTGEHVEIWNGQDDNNSNVASGVYYCVMRFNNHVDVKKMLLLK